MALEKNFIASLVKKGFGSSTLMVFVHEWCSFQTRAPYLPKPWMISLLKSSKAIKIHQNPIETHQNPSEPIETHQNPSKPHRNPIKTPSKSIEIHRNFIEIHRNPSKLYNIMCQIKIIFTFGIIVPRFVVSFSVVSLLIHSGLLNPNSSQVHPKCSQVH